MALVFPGHALFQKKEEERKVGRATGAPDLGPRPGPPAIPWGPPPRAPRPKPRAPPPGVPGARMSEGYGCMDAHIHKHTHTHTYTHAHTHTHTPSGCADPRVSSRGDRSRCRDSSAQSACWSSSRPSATRWRARSTGSSPTCAPSLAAPPRCTRS